MATNTKKSSTTKRRKTQHVKKTVWNAKFSHKIAVSGALALAAITFVAVTAVNIERSRIAQSASEASAPSAVIDLTQDGVAVSDLLVKKGQSVIWQTQDGGEHQLALAPASADAAGFGKGVVIDDTGSYNYVFNQTGTFYYYDVLNPELIKGIITVKE